MHTAPPATRAETRFRAVLVEQDDDESRGFVPEGAMSRVILQLCERRLL
jgi:hypothetical protein